ncbi:dTMP kinase [Paenibacillus sp. y28]|uniref:dTMP kinase n=1 Tax=Paenibacillus sp. y28 TaxID=3129110 RepID=UPI0030165671
MTKGVFITLEGGEGAGKSSIILRIAEWLRHAGIEVVVTREPGGIRIAERIREVILNPEHTEMDGRTEALLYAAARRQHLVEKVVPALQRGCVILCDRFIDSSLAYQGHARGIGIDEIWSINRFAIGDVMPDMTLYLDVPPEVGLKRIRANGEREINRLDLEASRFHEMVQEGYNQVLKLYPDRIVRIDASQAIEEVFLESCRVIGRRMKEFGIHLSN